MGVESMIREIQELAEKFFKAEDDEHKVSPYAQLEKAKVLQEARYVIVIGYSWCFVFGVSTISIFPAQATHCGHRTISLT